MRFRIERDALAEAVSWVARALPARPVIPVLSGMLIEAEGGTLALSCFDYDVSARFEMDADVAEPGTVLVPGRLLAEITRNLSGTVAEFASGVDSVELTCGTAEFTLVMLAVEDYPSLPKMPPPAGTVDSAEFAAAVAQVATSASRDDTLPMLTGVFAEIEGDTITLVSTDRYRLAVRELNWAPARSDLRGSALVPARALAEAARTMTSGGRVAIALQDDGAAGPSAAGGAGHEPGGMIGFESGGRRLTTRLIGGEFLKYSSRFPAEFGSEAEMTPGPLVEAVRRVALVAERGSAVRLAFGEGEVVIEAGSQGQARAVEHVPASFAGDERVIAFNPQYLLDGLVAAALPRPSAGHGKSAAADGDGASEDAAGRSDNTPDPGRIRLSFTSAVRPAVITWLPGAGHDAAEEPQDETPDFRYLVVPLRMPGSG
ncbi:MAG TPA: DNA polymerase III subunit beta [Streptosporangiaceae bacterium]|jgi:DNA polymerase-3 subunit beta